MKAANNTIRYSNFLVRDLTIHASTPCCGRRVNLVVHPLFAHERYERACRTCGFAWTIDRRNVDIERAGVRVDVLDWMSADYAAAHGSD